MTACSMLLICLTLVLSAAISVQAAELPPVERLPVVKELPDPFTSMDGTRVQSRDDWARRRNEIKILAQNYVYGFLPARGEKVRLVGGQMSASNMLPEAVEHSNLLQMGPAGKVTLLLHLTVPPTANSRKRLPVIVCGDGCWGRVAPEIVAQVVKRGYILAEFDRTEIAPDKNERTGVLQTATADTEFGALAAWAWGYSRVVDYLTTLPNVDGKRIAITGHSRGGKAVLLAGGMDERIALTAPNDAGCMGTGCSRIPHNGETVAVIYDHFPYWFSPHLKPFIGQEERLPFDQHTMKALVAPRALLDTEALQDEWANPRGAQITHLAAKTVFEFLGARDKIGIAYREGGHAHLLPDWEALLDFADKQFFGRKVARQFDALPYPEAAQKPYQWTAPTNTAAVDVGKQQN